MFFFHGRILMSDVGKLLIMKWWDFWSLQPQKDLKKSNLPLWRYESQTTDDKHESEATVLVYSIVKWWAASAIADSSKKNLEWAQASFRAWYL